MAIELDPASVSIRRSMGWLHYYARQPGQALEHLRRALAMNPTAEENHRLLGLAYLQLGHVRRGGGGVPGGGGELRQARRSPPPDSAVVAAREGTADRRARRCSMASTPRRGSATCRRWRSSCCTPAWASPTPPSSGSTGLLDDRRGWLAYLKVEPCSIHCAADARFTRLLERMRLADRRPTLDPAPPADTRTATSPPVAGTRSRNDSDPRIPPPARSRPAAGCRSRAARRPARSGAGGGIRRRCSRSVRRKARARVTGCTPTPAASSAREGRARDVGVEPVPRVAEPRSHPVREALTPASGHGGQQLEDQPLDRQRGGIVGLAELLVHPPGERGRAGHRGRRRARPAPARGSGWPRHARDPPRPAAPGCRPGRSRFAVPLARGHHLERLGRTGRGARRPTSR